MCVLVGTSAVRLSLYAAKRVTMDPVAAANIKGARNVRPESVTAAISGQGG